MKKKLLDLFKGATLSLLLGAALNMNAQTGSAINFDRVNDYVDLGTALTNSLANQNKFTLETWVKPNVDFTSGAYGCVVGNYGTLNNNPPMQFLLRGTNGTWQFFIQGGGTFTYVASAPFVVNQWQHVAATWDGTVGTIYVNGVFSNSIAMSSPGFTPATNPVWIGGNLLANEYFGGDIDEVRIWNRVLCLSEIQNNMNGELTIPQLNLLAYYKFNQGTAGGTNTGLTGLTDYGPSSVTGTLTNFALTGGTSNWVTPGGVSNGSLAPAFLGGSLTVNSGSIIFGQTFTMNPSGGSSYTFSSGSATVSPSVLTNYTVYSNVGGCLQKAISTVSVDAAAMKFDGANDRITVPNTATLNFGLGDFSVEAKVRFAGSNPNFAGLVSKDGGGPIGWQLVTYTNSIAAEFHNTPNPGMGVGNGLVGTTSLNDGNWHHVAMVVQRNIDNIKLYVDGQIQANVTNTLVSTFSVSNTNSLLIGCERNSSTFFNGTMDEVRLWNVARTQCEINNYMNCEIPANAPGLVANYHFNQGSSGAPNATVTMLNDATSNANNGTLQNIALTGTTSNWIAPGGVVSGYTTLPAPPNFSATSLSSCSGSSITLSGTGGHTYTWSAGVTDGVAFTPSASAAFTVNGTNTITTCTGSAVANVSVGTTPTISVNSGSICSGDSFTMVPGGASTYTFQGGNAVVSPTANATYTVVGTSSAGCVAGNAAVSSVTVVVCTGINELSSVLSGSRLYPNPAKGAVIISLPVDADVKVMDVVGKVLLNEKMNAGEKSVNISNFNPGIYFVKITKDDSNIIYN